MTPAAVATEAKAIPFDVQIRGIIPQILPWLAETNLWSRWTDRTFTLDPGGYHATDYGSPHVREREGVKELVGFLELSVGGKARWDNMPGHSAPRCEIVRPDYYGPRWQLAFWDLEGPADYMQAYAHHTPKIDISYWVRR